MAPLDRSYYIRLPISVPLHCLQLSVVALDFLSVSPSHNYPPLSLNSPPSNHLLSLSNSLIPKYQYLISIALPHLPHSRNLFLFFLMNLILFSLSLPPHLMNSSSLVTLTSTLIIFLITLPLSFFLFCRHLTNATC